MPIHALIRLVVVNFNGGEMTLDCLDRLQALDWPRERLEIVLVDNASTDGIAERVRIERPDVIVRSSDRNLGFAGGANLGLRELGDVEYVGFVNNDAFPEPDWLQPLVDVLRDDPRVGAAAPKILLAPRFVSVKISSPTFRPATGDPRSLGVMVSGVIVDGREATREAVFRSGFHGAEVGPNGPFQWTDGEAELWLPFDPSDAAPASVTLRLQSAQSTLTRASAGGAVEEVTVDTDPIEFELRVAGPAFDVINNVGSRLVSGGWAGDRGFMEIDAGQYDEGGEVFGWCGAAVLLSRDYLESLGGFDDRLFLYYEDTDLSWRGRLQGWRYRYAPESRVRHMHSATSGEGSALFNHFVDRNRLLVFLRNAPLTEAVRAVSIFVEETTKIALRDVVRPALRREPRHPERARQKMRALAGFARLAPAASLHRMRTRTPVGKRTVASWAEPR